MDNEYQRTIQPDLNKRIAYVKHLLSRDPNNIAMVLLPNPRDPDVNNRKPVP